MKKLLLFVLALALIFAFAACGQQSTTTTPTTTPEPETQAEVEGDGVAIDTNLPLTIDYVDFVSGNTGGSWQQVAVAIADRANTNFFDGFPITALPGGGASNPVTLHNGDAGIGMAGGPFLVRALDGEDPYEEQMDDLCAIAALVPIAVFYVVQDSYDVQTFDELITDLGDAAIGTSPAGNTTYYDLRNTFAAYGIDDVDAALAAAKGSIIYGDGTTLNNNWSDNHINVYVYCTTNPSSTITESMTTRAAHLVSLSEEAVEVLCEEYGYIRYVVEAGTYPNQDEEILTVAEPTILFCRNDVSNEVAYYLAKTIYENKDYIASANSAYSQLDIEALAENTVLELHPGAAAYYQEIGLIK